jgi:periplasmic divalent cation tolerance protein
MVPGDDAAVVVAMTTVPDAGTAERIATTLVDERLAACANILPGVTSVYRWRGEVERASEVLVLFKTTDERSPALRARLLELHPYDVPELVVLPVVDGAVDYLAWVRSGVVVA